MIHTAFRPKGFSPAEAWPTCSPEHHLQAKSPGERRGGAVTVPCGQSGGASREIVALRLLVVAVVRERVAHVTDQNFESEVLRSDKPVIVDFWAEWCGPCRAIAPIIDELARTHGDRVKIAKLDIDAHPNTPGRYGVRAIPTILAFKDGAVVQQLQGARPKADFEAMVRKLTGE